MEGCDQLEHACIYPHMLPYQLYKKKFGNPSHHQSDRIYLLLPHAYTTGTVFLPMLLSTSPSWAQGDRVHDCARADLQKHALY